MMERMSRSLSKRNALKFLGAAGGGLALANWAHGSRALGKERTVQSRSKVLQGRERLHVGIQWGRTLPNRRRRR
jgi:hypothetical protein